MQVAVWDTYATKRNGSVMHFDILVPAEQKDAKIIYNFGKEYLLSKKQFGQSLSSEECKFCHTEEASPIILENIHQKGYHIIEIDNCS